MAIGGSLRAALKAGNWAKTALESRRRARALADLNARGGIGGRGGRGGPEGAIDYLRNTGVDPAANQRFMDTGQMYAGDFNPAFESGRLFGYDMPGGRVGFLDPVTRSRQTQAWRGGAPDPIQAPYEGFRPLRYDPDYMMGGPYGPELPPVPRVFDPPRGVPLPPMRRVPPVSRRPEPSMFFDDYYNNYAPWGPTPAQLDAHYNSLWNQWNF